MRAVGYEPPHGWGGRTQERIQTAENSNRGARGTGPHVHRANSVELTCEGHYGLKSPHAPVRRAHATRKLRPGTYRGWQRRWHGRGRERPSVRRRGSSGGLLARRERGLADARCRAHNGCMKSSRGGGFGRPGGAGSARGRGSGRGRRDSSGDFERRRGAGGGGRTHPAAGAGRAGGSRCRCTCCHTRAETRGRGWDHGGGEYLGRTGSPPGGRRGRRGLRGRRARGAGGGRCTPCSTNFKRRGKGRRRRYRRIDGVDELDVAVGEGLKEFRGAHRTGQELQKEKWAVARRECGPLRCSQKTRRTYVQVPRQLLSLPEL